MGSMRGGARQLPVMLALVLVTALALSGCASFVPPPQTVSVPPSAVTSVSPSAVGKAQTEPIDRDAEPRDAWVRVLDRFVDAKGRVAFDRLARDRSDLDRYVDWVYRVGPNNQPERFPTRDHVLAYHLNAYNALAMYAVIQDGQPKSLASFWKKVSFFFLTRYQVGGVKMSLADYENKIIRRMGDPRVHFALNCMSVSCPELPREPFDAAVIQQQLDRETREFFADSRNLEVDHRNKTVTLSEILQFFPEDFLTEAPSVLAYAARYSPTHVPLSYAVRFRPYDWTVNVQP